MSNYTAKDIEVLDIIEAIRLRPSMYVGSADENAVAQCVLEIISNSVDEAMNGYGKRIEISATPTLYCQRDYGRGIPFDIKEGETESILLSILTKAHSGGKFDGHNYASGAGGLHGLGTKCANALSKHFKCISYRDKKCAIAEFKCGKLINFEEKSTNEPNGTYIEFSIDETIIDNAEFDIERIEQQVKELSFLVSGIEFKVNDKVFFSKDGVKDFIKDKVDNNITNITCIHAVEPDFTTDIAFTYTKDSTEKIYAYANNIPNADGGTHITGAKTALTTQLNNLAKTKGLIKENLSGEALRRGIVMIVSVKMKETPAFTSQNKTKLNNPIARTRVSAAITNNLVNALSAADLEKIIKKALVEQKAEEAANRAREAAEKIKSGGKSINALKDLPSKLADCSGSVGCELFLCEGDSAAGGAKQARDPKTQAIMPLRGKILNTCTKDIADMLKNKEIRDIATALGTGIGEKFNIKNLRYDKIIIESDADEDGRHISLLICTLFLYHFPEIVKAGKLYRAVSPFYSVKSRGGKKTYFYSTDEMNEYRKSHRVDHVTRYKGLGELDSSELWETTMNPETRRLVQLTISDLESTIELFDTLMGKDAHLRREFITENAEEDDFDF